MRFLFIGDLMCHDEQLMAMKYGDNYNFDASFGEIKDTFSKYDYVVCNLETVLTDGPYNGYPKFSSPKSFCGSAIKSGINCFMLANNHICDRGVNGVKSTINYLESNDIVYTGVGVDNQSKPLLIGDVAILNYTNKMNVNDKDVIYNNLNDASSIKNDIEYSRKLGAKIVIAVVHWGNEYEINHSREQESIARQLVNMGVDVIIGSHPHVIQDIGNIQGRVVAYSLGNFLSSQTEEECKESIGVELDIDNGYIMKVRYLKFNIFEDNGIVKVKEIN